jgi:aldose 1-epimerase
MFDIQSVKLGKFAKYKLLNSESGECLSLISGFGGNVTEMVLNKNGIGHSIIEGLSDDEMTTGNIKFKSTKLIPFPNRIENGKYDFNGKSYQLPINYERHAVHGLIIDKTLEVVGTKIDKNQAAIKLRYRYDGHIPGYPFKYEAIITYSLLKERGFVCDTTITNVDSLPLPIGDGWHPYYKTKGKVDKLKIRIPSKYRVEVNELIPTGKLIPEEYPDAITIGNRKYDTGFVLEEGRGRTSTDVYDPELDIKIVVWQETGKWKYNYLQVFIPEDRNSIAIEPMSCAANAFNNRMGLIALEPGQSFKASYGVYVE